MHAPEQRSAQFKSLSCYRGACYRGAVESIITWPQPFRLSVPEGQLADLQQRLAAARLPEPTPGEAWAAGTDLDYLAGLLRYWQDGFDWRRQEAWLNSFPQFTVRIEGQLVHFVHVRAPGGTAGSPAPIPIILSHGWPYSFAEMLPLAQLLANGPGPAFDVVIPSLPGFAFSEPMRHRPFTADGVARLWHRLMTEALGYQRYASYGEDVGAGVSDWTAALFPDAVLGLFATHAAFPPAERRKDLAGPERDFVAWLDRQWERERGYSMEQSTKPDTLAVGLNDSPAGLAAWLVEKFRGWSGCAGEVERAWSRDQILTTVMLYWVTGSIGSSFRPYYDGGKEPALPQVTVPVGVAVQHGERGFPRSYAERTYTDIRHWTELPSGGHFTGKESPELVASQMRAFFSRLL